MGSRFVVVERVIAGALRVDVRGVGVVDVRPVMDGQHSAVEAFAGPAVVFTREVPAAPGSHCLRAAFRVVGSEKRSQQFFHRLEGF